MDVEAEIDRLYSLPLAEFVTARNALAKKLRAAGDREQADVAKALAKPNVPAWAVNRLWHGEREAFDRLLDAAAGVRDAVAAGRGQRAAAARRSEAAKRVAGLARKLLSAAGHPATPAVMQKVHHTLDAVAALGVERLDPPPGRLNRDLEPPGFDFLAGLELPPAPKRRAPASTRPGKKKRAAKTASKPVESPPAAAPDDRQKKRIETARRALEESRAALAKAEKEAEGRERELAAARKRAAQTADAAKRAREAAKKAEKAAGRAAEREAEAAKAEKEAAKAARAARIAARRASARVKTGTDRLAKLTG